MDNGYTCGIVCPKENKTELLIEIIKETFPLISEEEFNDPINFINNIFQTFNEKEKIKKLIYYFTKINFLLIDFSHGMMNMIK